MMDEAGGVDEDVDGPDLLGEGIDRLAGEHVELALLRLRNALQQGDVLVGRPDGGALGDESLGDGPADPLPRGGDDRDLALQTSCHARFLLLPGFC